MQGTTVAIRDGSPITDETDIPLCRNVWTRGELSNSLSGPPVLKQLPVFAPFSVDVACESHENSTWSDKY